MSKVRQRGIILALSLETQVEITRFGKGTPQQEVSVPGARLEGVVTEFNFNRRGLWHIIIGGNDEHYKGICACDH